MAHPARWLLASALLAVMLCFAHADCPDLQKAADRLNFLRAKHGSPPMTISDQLVQDSQRYAEVALRNGGCDDLQHDTLDIRRVGENLFARVKFPARVTTSCTSAMNDWYGGEVHLYNYNNVRATWERASHFTRLVWAASTSFGCGMASGLYQGDGSCTIVVCRFAPGGNVNFNESKESAYARNVKRPNGDPSTWVVDPDSPEGGDRGNDGENLMPNSGNNGMGGGDGNMMGGGGGGGNNFMNEQRFEEFFHFENFEN